jgi:hypothetical protein
MWFTRVSGANRARPEHGRLAAREKGQMKAWTLVTTRGVRAAHLMHKVPGDGPRARRRLPGYQAAGLVRRTWHKRIVRSEPRTASSPASDSGAASLLTALSFPRTWNRIRKVGSACARWSSRGSSTSWSLGSSSILLRERGRTSSRWSPLPRDPERAPNTFRL